MVTKITAAKIATSAGVCTVITQGKTPATILKIIDGERHGTQFLPQAQPNRARKQWIAHGLVPAGRLYLDLGAVRAICEGGKSLLAAGITEIEGEFQADDAVILCDRQGKAVAQGLVNFDSAALGKSRGRRSQDVSKIIGNTSPNTVIHRDNLVLL
ncbi:MAG: PUA domain-containing protein [Cyanophyceae cyanobacterium]